MKRNRHERNARRKQIVDFSFLLSPFSFFLSPFMKRNTSINDILKPLGDKPYQAYLSNVLQVADVLEWVLEQVGTAEVWQTSFSISEEFLRRLFFIEKSGRVKRFNLVLDHKATNKTLKLWAFITQVIERTYLADNHSKILLVRSDAGDTVSVVTSQNLTRGNRSESAFITTDKEIFATLHAQVQELIKGHSVPLNDLFTNKIAEQ
ncbi:MAG: hypothetical protein IJY83_00580 [Oscillospiraceae bacterium]|nr:hypothetical protein [Oscillospiraceae bacterium]